MPDQLNIPQAIKDIRKELGITQRQLANLIGYEGRQRIADYENNRSRISAVDWLKIQGLRPQTKGE